MVSLSISEIFRLIGSFLVIVASFLLFYIGSKKLTFYQKLSKVYQNLIIVAFFAGIAISIFWLGIDFRAMYNKTPIVGRFGGATAVPVLVALIFSWPAGIATGFLSSLYRLFAYPFGIGDYLRTAECVSLLLSGIIGALLNRFLFDKRKPKWGYGFIIGILIETIHMLLIFITGMTNRDVKYAYGVIRQCDLPCALVVIPSIMVSLFVIALYQKESIRFNLHDNKIASKIQKWMLVSFGVAILGASLLTYFTVSTESSVETHTVLSNAARDVVYELETAEWGEDDILWSQEEIEKICYTRRVRDLGYVTITGVEDDNGPYYFYDENSPGERGEQIKQDQIYSSAVLMKPYVEHEEKGVLCDKKQNPIHFDMSDDLVLRVADFLANSDDEIEELEPWNHHPITPMFEAYVFDKYDDKGNLKSKPDFVNVIGVMVQATILNNENTHVVQRFNVTALLTMEEAKASMGMPVRIAIYIELLIFTAVYGVIYTFIKRSVVNNVQRINNSLEKITSGDLSIKVNVRSNAEFSSLSDDINQTVDTLKNYVSQTQKRMEQELVFAETIQKSALPYIFPTTNEYDLFADMHPAKQVGGDFYDFFLLNNNRIFFLIADVSGKGIPAAMFMMRSQMLIKSLVQTDEMELDHIISSVNDELCNNNEAQMFVTCWCAILDINTGHMKFVNAGHNPPIIKRKGGKFEELKMAKNFVLAGMENVTYKLEETKLNPGDEILIYTDGVTEATNKDKQLYGIERFLEFVNKTNYKTSFELIGKINVDLVDFQKDVEQADDITMLMLRYKSD